MVALVSRADRPAAGRARAGPGCARSTRSARRRSRSNAEREALPLLRLPEGRRRDRLREETEGLDFPEARGAARRALRRELKREREDPRRRSGASGASACWSCSSAPPASTRATCGSRPRRPGARLPRRARAGGGGAAGVPRRLRAQAPGTGCSPAPAAAASPRQELLAAGLAQRAAQRQPARPLPRADHVPAGRQPRPGARLRRARDARRAGRRSTSTPPRARSTTRAASCSASTARAAAIAKAGHVVVVEGYTDVLALHAAGVEEAVGDHGHRAHPGAGRRAGAGVGAEGRVSLALDADRSGQEAMLRAARIARERQTCSCGWCGCPRAAIPRTWWRPRGAEAVRERLDPCGVCA